MRAFAVAPVVLLFLASCRQTMTVNTDSSESIPAEVAVSKLQELLPTVDSVECRSPKATIEHEKLKEWKIDATGVGFHGQDNDQYRFRYADIRSTEFTRVHTGSQPIFEVALFVPGEDLQPKDMFRFNWFDETRARKALELFEAMRRKQKV
jgi:hypothetical protein